VAGSGQYLAWLAAAATDTTSMSVHSP